MTEFSGPPEPIVQVNDDGEEIIKVAYIHEDTTRNPPETYPKPVELGTWVCERCGNEMTIPVQNGELTEPYECDGCERQGPFNHKAISKEDVQTALRAGEIWFPPTDIPDTEIDGLWDHVREYIYDHWDAQEPEVYDGLTAYALSTWFRPNLTFVPHLMLMGKTTGGKTRLLNTLARVSYRAVVSASATPASMYRMIDAYDVSFFVSEYHGLPPDSRRELDNVVRAGQKRGEIVTRAEQSGDGYEPDVYDPFSHIAIATQFTPDDDIINRCIRVRSSPERREMPATLDEPRATAIRNRLLTARFRLLDSDKWDSAEREAYAYLEEQNITGRTREKLLSLVTVAILWDHLDDLEPFIEVVVNQDQAAASDSEDARFVEVVRDLAFEEIPDVTIGEVSNDPFAAVEIPLTRIAERYESMTGIEKSPSWVGHVRSRLGLEKETKRDGTVICDDELGPKLRQLCDEHNLAWEASDVHDPVRELPEDESGYRNACNECGQMAEMTHKHAVEGYHMCTSCAQEWREAEPV